MNVVKRRNQLRGVSRSFGLPRVAEQVALALSVGIAGGQGACVDDPPIRDDDGGPTTYQGTVADSTTTSSGGTTSTTTEEETTTTPTSTETNLESQGPEETSTTTSQEINTETGTLSTGDPGTEVDDESTEIDAGTSTETSETEQEPTPPENGIPQVSEDVYRIRQNATLEVDLADGVLGNDSDPDGDELSVPESNLSSEGGGNVLLRRDGSFEYTPAPNWWGEDSFTYSASDGQATVQGTVRVIVSPVSIPARSLVEEHGGFVIEAEAEFDQLGVSVAGQGDVDGDGLSDLILGSVSAGLRDDHRPGRAYVVFGKTDREPVSLSRIAGGQGGFAIQGEAHLDALGWSTDIVGDMNQDGLPELVVGAWRRNVPVTEAGRSYVVFGKTNGALVQLTEVVVGDGGFAIFPNPEDGPGQMGRSVSAAGDVNDDGIPDVVIGALGAAPNQTAGRSYVVFGKNDSDPVELADIASGNGGGFVINGEAPNDFAGRAVSGAGDVNGDGFDDLVIGVRNADLGGSDTGRTYVIFGKEDGAAVQLSDIVAGQMGFAIDGEESGDWAGSWVSGAGDVNGDGRADIILGARQADRVRVENPGRSYVVFGKTNTARVYLLDVYSGHGGFAIDGEVANDETGNAVGGAGDVNGDGLDDLIVGAWQRGLDSSSSDFGPGKAFVVYGKSDNTRPVVLADVATGQGGGFRIQGEVFGDAFGSCVSGAGDLNGDGFADVVIGAWEANPGGTVLAGRAYVVLGGDFR